MIPLVPKLPLGNVIQEAPASPTPEKLELPECGSQAGAWEPGEQRELGNQESSGSWGTRRAAGAGELGESQKRKLGKFPQFAIHLVVNLWSTSVKPRLNAQLKLRLK
jgi:hypothetical protein